MLKLASRFGCLLSLVVVLYNGNVAADEPHFFVKKMSFEDRVKVLESMTDTCDVKPTIQILKEILLFEHNVHRETKCFLRCLVEWFDLHVTDAHHVDVDRVMEFCAVLFPDTQEHIRSYLHDCNVEISNIEDVCDAAYAHLVCMHKKMIANGIEIPNFEE